MIDKVYEFNETLLMIPRRPVGMLGDDEAIHLEKALREELQEFVDGQKLGDMIATVDSLIDLVYFAFGGLYKMGVPVDAAVEIFHAMHDCNMTKRRGSVERRAVGLVADAVKPDGWVPPEERIGEILSRYAHNDRN